MASDIYTQSDFLMIKIACMYYLENIQQPQIAKELNISITTVSRFLKRAKEEKIIRYIIDDKYMHQIELAEKIRLKYNLEEVIIASNPVLEEGIAPDSHIMRVEKRKKVALEAARYRKAGRLYTRRCPISCKKDGKSFFWEKLLS